MTVVLRRIASRVSDLPVSPCLRVRGVASGIDCCESLAASCDAKFRHSDKKHVASTVCVVTRRVSGFDALFCGTRLVRHI